MKVLDENKLQAMAAYITDYIHENNGESPKFAEILNYMNMSKSVGYRYLTRLNERGIITYSAKERLRLLGRKNEVGIPSPSDSRCCYLRIARGAGTAYRWLPCHTGGMG